MKGMDANIQSAEQQINASTQNNTNSVCTSPLKVPAQIAKAMKWYLQDISLSLAAAAAVQAF
uniref:Uncharacterized protein n=1 Tax=Pristionchus pacificus TaxID=54126 RepID=A0A2A6BX64_PRIPA|eukprot:PDM70479.1 hypothetical protein PRIPAC_46725 [Pristionchus pacificus]